jgi:serine/threonine protein kinase
MSEKIQSYEIIEQIGMGGMGVVYRARQIFRNEIVAIKTLSPQFAQDPSLRVRFYNEALILNKLDHKNIVRVTDFIELPKELHLVTEFIEGRTLDKIIGKEVGPIPYSKALQLFKQIVEGISYAHKKGVIHRDIKPSNIIVTPNGEVKITDFGIAKIQGDVGFTKTGTKMGTIYYMSPEQIRGEHVDERSDIYSLGITLFEMLAGRKPFEIATETSDFNLMNKIVTEQLPDPRTYYPSIPEWLVDVVIKAITKEKTNRIKSCDEFLSLLENEPYSKPEISPNIVITDTPKKEYVPKVKKSATITTPNKTDNFKLKIILGSLSEEVTLLQKTSITRPRTDKSIVFVEEGTLKMGSNDSRDIEKPTRRVLINGFYIGKYEVTQKEWVKIMGSNPSYYKGDNLPVENVSWKDVQEYIRKLNAKTRKNYRLPTEEEWEYAARGGNRSKGYKYSGSNNIDEVGWYEANSNNRTHEVGTKKPNELGIYDMSGNVWEWCNDWYDENYYKNGPRFFETQGGSSGTCRVLRGGSWNSYDYYCRSTNRNWVNPNLRNYFFGFRLARDL